jgi:hypothetical protein
LENLKQILWKIVLVIQLHPFGITAKEKGISLNKFKRILDGTWFNLVTL